MAWTLCTSGASIIKAGVGANSDIVISGAFLASWSDEVEGRIVAETRRDWVDSFPSVDSGVKLALQDVASDLIAMKIISYDMSGYAGSREAETILDVLKDNSTRVLNELKDFKSNTVRDV